jgi:uncharacterized membrane protein YdjX (TVP38/TMEM64 family)
MDKKAKARTIFWLVITLIPIAGLVLSLTDPKEFHDVQLLWRDRIAAFGMWGPVAFVILQILQVVITPISHYTVGAIGGFLYGPYWGGLLNWIGRMIGHSIAFFLAHKFGRKVVDKFVDEKTMAHFDRYVAGEQNGLSLQSFILFLIYFLPLFPDDEISYIVGISKMRYRTFLVANLFGQVGGSLSLAYLGSGLSTQDALFWVLFISTLAGFPLIWILQRRYFSRHRRTQESK